MAISADKVPGVRAVMAHGPSSASAAKVAAISGYEESSGQADTTAEIVLEEELAKSVCG